MLTVKITENTIFVKTLFGANSIQTHTAVKVPHWGWLCWSMVSPDLFLADKGDKG